MLLDALEGAYQFVKRDVSYHVWNPITNQSRHPEVSEAFNMIREERENLLWIFKHRTRAILNTVQKNRKGRRLLERAKKAAKHFEWEYLIPKAEYPKPKQTIDGYYKVQALNRRGRKHR